jgi:eukaryotic-like serine/threonine-protein kinase
MVRRDGVVKILDFGLVKLLGDTDPRLTATGEGVAAPGLDRAGLLAARAGAALCVGALGRTRQALDELKSVLAERRGLLGPGHSAVLDTRYEIAVLLVRTGERPAAEELPRRLADEEDTVLPASGAGHGRGRAPLERLRRMS